MSSEIDLQLLLTKLRQRWWLIALFVVLALAIALGLSLAQPKRYQSTNTLLVQSPRYQWRFDASILPLVDTRRDLQRELLAIGRGSQMGALAAEKLQASGQPGLAEPAGLASAVSLRAGDGNTLLITAEAHDPQAAAAIANAWAASLIDQARKVYGVEQDLASFQAELATAEQRLRTMESHVADVRAQTGLYAAGEASSLEEQLSIAERELILKNQRLAEYNEALNSVRYLQSLLGQAQPGADLAQLPWELLDSPVLGQRGLLTPQTARAQLGEPAALLALLRQEESSLTSTADQLSSEAQQIQAELAANWQLYGQANLERNLAKETYTLLSRKVTEAAMQQRVDPGLLTTVSEATPPAAPVRTRQLAQAVTAGVIGLILGMLVVWWLPGRPAALSHVSQTPPRQPV